MEANEYDKALHMVNIALKKQPLHQKTLLQKKTILIALLEQSKNVNEKGWLSFGIREIEQKLKGINKEKTYVFLYILVILRKINSHELHQNLYPIRFSTCFLSRM